MAKSQKPTVVDLFCGAGGFSLGFQAAGCRIQAAVDIDEVAGRSFSFNFQRLQRSAPPLLFFGHDCGDLNELDLGIICHDRPPDILIGAPPCQPFSLIGRAKLDSLTEYGFVGDPRNSLYRRFLNAAQIWRPLAVVMENVPGMLSMNGANIADEAAAELESHGYRAGYAVLNAVWYGVPQYRERLVLIAFRQDLGLTPLMPSIRYQAELPTGYFHSRIVQNETIGRQLSLFNGHESYQIRVETVPNLRLAVTVGVALADLPALTAHLEHYSPDQKPDTHYKDEQIPGYSTLMRCWPGFRPVRTLSHHVFRRTARDYETFRRMKPGDRYPEALAIARRRFEQELERLRALGLAPLLGTVEYDELKARFVPPYPEDIFVDKWRKLAPDKPSPTLPAHLSKDSYSHLHYDDRQGRSISVREAARLQSFPDAFQFCGNMGDCFRQIGNAVPPLMAWAIAHQLLTQLGVTPKPLSPDLELT